MANRHETQTAVPDAEVAHDKMPKDFALAVKDIKLAILQARANAARLANAEALKLYFFVGGYISKKTRNAKWGSGAVDAPSNQLQVELPGLRGFSAANIKYMRIFFDEWARWFEIRHLPSDENRQTASDEDALMPICHTLCDKLSLSHYRLLAAVDNRDARDFYLSEAVKFNASAPPLKRPWRFAPCRRQRLIRRPHLARPQKEASDGMSPAIVRSFDSWVFGILSPRERMTNESQIDR